MQHRNLNLQHTLCSYRPVYHAILDFSSSWWAIYYFRDEKAYTYLAPSPYAALGQREKSRYSSELYSKFSRNSTYFITKQLSNLIFYWHISAHLKKTAIRLNYWQHLTQPLSLTQHLNIEFTNIIATFRTFGHSIVSFSPWAYICWHITQKVKTEDNLAYVTL